MIAGMSALVLAVPLFAQISSAASTTTPKTRPALTQQNVQDLVAKDKAFLTSIDAMVTVEKSAVQAHADALTAAASITDDAQRQTAVQKADQDERTAIQNAMTANADLKSAIMPFGHGGLSFGSRGNFGDGLKSAGLASKLGMTEADLKTALAGGKTIQEIATEKGVTLPAPQMMGGRRGFGSAMLATKLGMTQDELKAALAGGKTIQEIATEKGITLPTPPENGGRPMGDHFGNRSSDSSAQ